MFLAKCKKGEFDKVDEVVFKADPTVQPSMFVPDEVNA